MDDTPILLKKLMDTCAVRQTVLANNLANINTPGFKRSDVEFKKALVDAVKAGDVGKIASAQTKIVTDKEARTNANGNTATTQTEMALMTDNSMLYSLSVRALSDKFSGLHKAIRGR